MTSRDAGAISSSISSPTEPSPMPMLSPAPSLTPSPVSTTSDNSNHRPFAGGLLRPSVAEASEVEIGSRFIVYQNRVETETYLFAGRRNDLLRRDNGKWLLVRREILLDQNVLLAKNLSVFF